jgi:hypothetical protein
VRAGDDALALLKAGDRIAELLDHADRLMPHGQALGDRIFAFQDMDVGSAEMVVVVIRTSASSGPISGIGLSRFGRMGAAAFSITHRGSNRRSMNETGSWSRDNHFS